MNFLDFLKQDNVDDFDLIEKAMSVKSEKEAREIMRQLRQHYRSDEYFGENTEQDLLKMIKDMLGYRASYYSDKVRLNVEKYFNTAHPIFGKLSEMGKPSAAEAYNCGLRNITLKQLRSEKG